MRPEWDNQFRETESERNARLMAKRQDRQRQDVRAKATDEMITMACKTFFGDAWSFAEAEMMRDAINAAVSVQTLYLRRA